MALAVTACGRAPDGSSVSREAAGDAPEPASGASTAAIVETPPPSAAPVVPSEPPPPSEAQRGARVYAKARFVWIHSMPSARSGWIGYLTLGGSVALRGGSVEAARAAGGESSGCTFYRVEPRGYVCAGGVAATLDPDDPDYVVLRRYSPKVESPWPFEYGESIGLPRYERVPSASEQRAAEWDLDEHLERVARGRVAMAAGGSPAIDEEIAGVDLRPAGREPPTLRSFGPLVREARKRIVKGSTVAYTTEFDVGGRAFLLAWDHAIVPKDRVRPYPRSEFEGVEIGEQVKLPLAFFRKRPRPQFRRDEAGAIVPAGGEWPRLARVGLTGQRLEHEGEAYLVTDDRGLLVKESDATVVRPSADPPFHAGELDDGKGRDTWVEVSVLGGWLIAYEGRRPVFATLISPGRGGIPVPGRDPLETASTPLGTFRVDGKFLTATMVSSSNDLLVHTEVQFVQNFHGPHALHGAYWHDVWGEPKSGGCVNLSPRDSLRMFRWSEPGLPEGWHGMRSIDEAGPTTIVVIHR